MRWDGAFLFGAFPGKGLRQGESLPGSLGAIFPQVCTFSSDENGTLKRLRGRAGSEFDRLLGRGWGVMLEKAPRNIILWFFLALFLVSAMLLGWLLWPFFSIIVLGAVVTGVFSPVYGLLLRKLSPPIASLATCTLIFFVLFVPIVFFVSILSKEAYDLYLMGKNAVIGDQVRTLLETSSVLERVNGLLVRFDISVSYEDLITPISEVGKFIGLSLFEQASAIATNILKFVVNFFFMLLVIFYLLMDGERLATFIVDLSPLPAEEDEKLIGKFKEMGGAILIGNGLAGLLQGIMGGALFAFFGLKSSFLWGVIMALLAFLPIAGIGVVMLPASLYLFLTGRVGAGVFFIVFYVVLSGGMEYIFKPKLVGHRVQMHTLVVFLSILGGLKLFGILGIIYGPLVVTFFLTLTDIYRSNYQKMVEPVTGKKEP